MTEDQSEGLWVTTDPVPDGRYNIVMSLDADRAWGLSPTAARMHAMAALTIAETALYEQSLYSQLTNQLQIDQETALSLIADFRASEPKVDRGALAPLDFVRGLNGDGESFIHIHLDGEPVGQINPQALIRHALAVSQVRVVAQLDTLYRRLLTEVIGIDDTRAMAAVNSLGDHRPDDGFR
jgi:hypothetical protein